MRRPKRATLFLAEHPAAKRTDGLPTRSGTSLLRRRRGQKPNFGSTGPTSGSEHRRRSIGVSPPRPVSPPRATPARELVAEAAAAIWASRRTFTAGKQRLTATRLWELLRDDGDDVSGRTVRRLVAAFRNAEREVTVPLVYAPGELAQVDFFEVWVEVESVRQKAWLFLMRLMHSGRDFAMVCAQQDTTWFLAAHVAAFRHFGAPHAGNQSAASWTSLPNEQGHRPRPSKNCRRLPARVHRRTTPLARSSACLHPGLGGPRGRPRGSLARRPWRLQRRPRRRSSRTASRVGGAAQAPRGSAGRRET
jgi:hypothetical protein